MISKFTLFKVVDTTGVKYALCISVFKLNLKTSLKLGTFILVTCKSLYDLDLNLNKKRRLKRGDLSKAVVIRHRNCIKRVSGDFFFFNQTAIALMADFKFPRGHRIYGVVLKELRLNNLQRILAIAEFVV